MIKKVVNSENVYYIKEFINDNFGEDVITNINKLAEELKYINLGDRDIIFLINTCDILSKNVKEILQKNIKLNSLENKELVNRLLKAYKFIIEVNKNVDNDELVHIADDYLSDDIVRSYLKNLPSRLLTFEELVALYKRIELGDETARETVVTYNLRLVVSVAKKYINMGVDLEDLISAGHEGLLLAVDKYDYKMGLMFSNYAIWWIRQTITRSIANESKIIRIPVYAYDYLLKIKKFMQNYYVNCGQRPSVETISKSLNLKEDVIESVLPYIDDVVSLNDQTKNDECNDTELIDLIKDDYNLEEEMFEKYKNKEFRDYVFNYPYLTDREKLVLSYRFGFEDGQIHTLEDVGQVIGVTRERIRQIENKAIKCLRTSPKLGRLCS